MHSSEPQRLGRDHNSGRAGLFAEPILRVPGSSRARGRITICNALAAKPRVVLGRYCLSLMLGPPDFVRCWFALGFGFCRFLASLFYNRTNGKCNDTCFWLAVVLVISTHCGKIQLRILIPCKHLKENHMPFRQEYPHNNTLHWPDLEMISAKRQAE